MVAMFTVLLYVRMYVSKRNKNPKTMAGVRLSIIDQSQKGRRGERRQSEDCVSHLVDTIANFLYCTESPNSLSGTVD